VGVQSLQESLMASHLIVPNESDTRADRQLSADEGWELIFQSFGSGKELYAEFGGGEAFLRAERAAWEQPA
jgi:hypothetical protein